MSILLPDLILVIIELLFYKDQQTFSLLSQSCRQLAVPYIFRRIGFSNDVAEKIKRFNGAGRDVVAAIKELVVIDSCFGQSWDYESILFPFLRRLSNLRIFEWRKAPWLRNQGFLHLAASLQPCPLEEFTYLCPFDGYYPEEPITAPPGLKSLSIACPQAHLYDFIHPSFSTLVELEINSGSGMVDFLPLKPLGGTLRVFVYQEHDWDLVTLETIPDVFPHLVGLGLFGKERSRPDVRWENSYEDAIAKNTKLQYLVVSAKGFVFCDSDPLWRHLNCRKCKNQRVEATRTLARACSNLVSCRWDHGDARFGFNVKLSRKSTEGNSVVRVGVYPVSVDMPFY